ncbi:MAG TPA: glycosyltransferase family 4 protein [Blastocatellia bacterium]|nr:glycosyltransferase family 4 protein [Blastocatellia bacterium]
MMKPLKIVLVMIEPPLPFGNAAARWYYVLLNGLVARGHEVKAFAACSKEDDIVQAQKLFPAPQFDLRCYPHPHRHGLSAKWETLRRPYSYMFSNDFKRDLEAELAKGFDLLHLEQLWGLWLKSDYPARTLVSALCLARVDLRHVRKTNWQRRFESSLMSWAEEKLLRRAKNLYCLSQRDANEIREVNPRCQISIAKLGIDISLYKYISDSERATEPLISLIGSLNWYPTFSAAEKLLTVLWPKIKQQVPKAQLQIIGWKAREVLQQYIGMADVTIEENVPQIEPYFRKTNILLYPPSNSSGIQVKLQEAMAYGVPIVTNQEGAEGLSLQSGIHAEICETDEELVTSTVALLRDVERQNRQRYAARKFLESHFAPEPALNNIEEIYRKMLLST